VYCELLDVLFTLCFCYFRHSEELIKRLEQAGLGYHVDADKTTDRFGTEYSINHTLCIIYFSHIHAYVRLSILHFVSSQYLKFLLSKSFEIYTQDQDP
jgi:hypothetical protein